MPRTIVFLQAEGALIQGGVCLGHDDQEHTIDFWLLKQLQLLHQGSHGTHVWRAQFDGVNVFVCPVLLLVKRW